MAQRPCTKNVAKRTGRTRIEISLSGGRVIEVEPCRARVVEGIWPNLVWHPWHTYSVVGVELRSARLVPPDKVEVTFRRTQHEEIIVGRVVNGVITWLDR